MSRAVLRQAGQLSEFVTIQVPTTPVSDGAGGFTYGWTNLAKVWARVDRLSGRRLLDFGSVDFREAYQVTIRDNWNFTHESRLLYGTKVMTIHSIDAKSDQIILIVFA